MSKLLVANWKMNPQSYAEAEKLVNAVRTNLKKREGVEVVLCPPFSWLTDFSHKSPKAIHWGAQDAFWENKGAYTGEISPVMLKNSGVEHVILGHSERRKFLGETDEMVNKKIIAALKAGLKVIFCVGESAAVRKKGIAAAKSFVANQLKKGLPTAKSYKLKVNSFIIVYEPIWAISTSRSATSRDNADTPENAVEMVRFIRGILANKFRVSSSVFQVLYGGSVTSKNTQAFLERKEIGGALVGSASLRAGEFKKIIRIAEKL